RLAAVAGVLREAGHCVDWVTGGGTGSFATDAALGVLTEVQPGSYIFMDSQYRDALGHDADGEFEQSLFVQARIVSINAASHVTVDAGLKAFATDGPLPRPAGGRFADCRYFWYGDEHGGLSRPASDPAPALGERVEFIPPHCDPTVDRYDRLVMVRGDTVVDVAPLEAARRESRTLSVSVKPSAACIAWLPVLSRRASEASSLQPRARPQATITAINAPATPLRRACGRTKSPSMKATGEDSVPLT